MDDLETRLRDELTRAADVPPPAAGLADRVVARGRRARRTRAAGLAAAAVVVVVAAAGLLAPGVWQRDAQPATPVKGLPRVPLLLGQSGEVVDWPGGQERRRPVSSLQAVASLPFGVLLNGADALWLLAPDDPRPRRLLGGITGDVAVSHDGRRVAVISGRTLRELELPTLRVLRTLDLRPPLIAEDEWPQLKAYSGAALLVNVRRGVDNRVVLVEGGTDEVAASLPDWPWAVGGAPAPGGGPGGRGAFFVAADCRTEIVRLATGGAHWGLCREPFAGFSPGGRWVLATDATGEGLVVRDAGTGELEREWDAPSPLRAQGWESDDAVLYAATEGRDTVVIRCVVSSGRCATAVNLGDEDVLPQPVPPHGG